MSSHWKQLDVPPTTGRQPRVALYSHDTQGLGHIRRNMLIARALCRGGETPVILLLSGLRETASFAMPQGVDCLTLPSLGKDADGRYFPRSLGVSMPDLIDVRRRSILAALQAFDPDVLIVDKVPRGAFDELEPSLEWMSGRERGRLVLGLREILDDPDTVRREWDEGQYEAAVRHYYDRIWVYGDPAVYDTAAQYEFPTDIRAKIQYTGYLNFADVDETEERAPAPTITATSSDTTALCVVGGGRDGVPLAHAFLLADVPAHLHRVLVTGPLMPADDRATLNRLADAQGRCKVVEFTTDPRSLLEQADRIIAMGGYNTVCEILSVRKPALIIPRVTPRTEQLIRASRFAERGMIDMLHPDDLGPQALSDWLSSEQPTRPDPRDEIDFNGVARLPELLDELMTEDSGERRPTHACG